MVHRQCPLTDQSKLYDRQDCGKEGVVAGNATILEEYEVLESFTIDTFAGHHGDTFIARAGDAELLLRLAEVTPLWESGGRAEAHRQAFSLVFVAHPSPVCEQRIYELQHPHIGEFELFLVPIGPGPEGMRYQAIFT